MIVAPQEVRHLVERFARNREAYKRPAYNETQVRREFIDPLFKALGWDIDNEQGYAEAYKDVVHEDAIKVGGATKAPDYCFRIGGSRKFFLEAKKPAIPLKDSAEPAYQLRRYAWSAKLPLSILTDFEELAVYDCRIRPRKTDKPSTGRTMYFTCDEYLTRWDELAAIFARDAVLKGSFDKYAESARRKRGTAEVDVEFLKEIERWRELIARNFALRNRLSVRDVNFAVQRTIDRIIFLRMCEDRAIEPYGQLQALLNGQAVYARLGELFRRADERYNSSLFYFTAEKGREPPDELTLALNLDDRVLKEIISGLYYPESPYEFYVLPPEILGHVYEQFLGKVIRLTRGGQAKVEEKPEVRKAGGVYYTPTYIVDYIVEHTVGKLLEERVPGSGTRGSAGQASDSGGPPNGDQALSRPRGVAAGDGPGGSGLSPDQGPARRGTLRTQQPDPTVGRLDPGQHSRGPRPTAPPGVHPSLGDRAGFAGRTGDAPDAGGSAGLPETRGHARNVGTGPARRSAPQRAHRRAQKKNRAPGPKPLAPVSRLRILDPACGSGSFLLGAYQYLLDWHRDWYVAQMEGTKGPRDQGIEEKSAGAPNSLPATQNSQLFRDRIYQGAGGQWRLTIQEKKRILLNNIYGVDIDPQAVEVTKLSLLLKVLEGETAETIGSTLRLFHERALPDLSDNIKCGNSLIGPDFYEGKQLSMFDEEERLRINAFDWETEFPDVFPRPEPRNPNPDRGFDAVIGNPPWGAPYSDEEKDYLRSRYAEVHVRTPESFNYFLGQMWRCTRSQGLVGTIVASSFLGQHEFYKTRQMLVASRLVRSICDLGDGVFPSVTAPCCIVVFGATTREGAARYLDLRREDRAVLPTTLGSVGVGQDVAQFGDASDSFLLRPQSHAELFRKCHLWPPLREVAEDVATGISSGLDKAYVYEARTATRLGLEEDTLRKLIIGGEITRYCLVPSSGKLIVYVTPDTDMTKYPNCRAALSPYRERLMRRREAANGKIPWFSLNWPRRKKLFDRPKILIRQTADRILAGYDRESWYCLKSAIIVQLPADAQVSHEYLLGLLNSRLMALIYDRLVGEKARVFPEVKPVQLFKLPIRTIDFSNRDDKARHDRMVDLVQQMLDLHKHLSAAKTPHEKAALQRQIDATDRQIDQLVYELYGLTDEEIKLVEEATRC